MTAPTDLTVICTYQEPDGTVCAWKISGIPNGNVGAYAGFALDAAKRRLGEHVLEAHAQLPDEHANAEAVPTEAEPTEAEPPRGDDLLTDDELAALRLSGELADRLRRIVAGGEQTENDWAELAQALHVIQRYVGSQAAARAYPGQFRLLGRKMGDL